MVLEKESEISRLGTVETEKDLRIEMQQRDFQNQLIPEQAACQQVSGTLAGLQQELEAIRSKQNTQNPMDVSSTTDTVYELYRVKQQAKQEKCSIEERLQNQKPHMNKPYKIKIAK